MLTFDKLAFSHEYIHEFSCFVAIFSGNEKSCFGRFTSSFIVGNNFTGNPAGRLTATRFVLTRILTRLHCIARLLYSGSCIFCIHFKLIWRGLVCKDFSPTRRGLGCSRHLWQVICRPVQWWRGSLNGPSEWYRISIRITTRNSMNKPNNNILVATQLKWLELSLQLCTTVQSVHLWTKVQSVHLCTTVQGIHLCTTV